MNSNKGDAEQSGSPHFYFTGGCLALDFVNSKSWRLSALPNDRLQDFAALLSFCRDANIVDSASAAKLGTIASQNSRDAKKTVNQALKLRELIYRLFLARVEGRAVDVVDLKQFNRMLSDAQRRLQVELVGEQWLMGWGCDSAILNRLWWDIAIDAARVFTLQGDIPIRACGGQGCGWLFLDTSRNHSRRWCDMRVCGNRDKVKRYQKGNKKHE